MPRTKTPIIVAFCLSIAQLSFGKIETPANVANRAPSNDVIRFHFASDGPLESVWGRAKEVGRVYVPELAACFFSQTIIFHTGIPLETKLSWIFTGRIGGFSVEVSHSQIRVYQRFYDSYGVNDVHISNPERIVQSSIAPLPDTIHSLTVTLDAHLMLVVRVNNSVVIRQRCLLDVTRHQMRFQGPRTKHLEVSGALYFRTSQRYCSNT